MCIGYTQILCYFIKWTWASANFAICRGLATSPPWILRDNCVYTFKVMYTVQYSPRSCKCLIVSKLSETVINLQKHGEFSTENSFSLNHLIVYCTITPEYFSVYFLQKCNHQHWKVNIGRLYHLILRQHSDITSCHNAIQFRIICCVCHVSLVFLL